MQRPTPLRALRRFCLDCQGDSATAVEHCADTLCALWAVRTAERPAAAETRLILRAVRRHCMNCAGDRREIRACAAREHCPLWSLRFGVLPETYKAVRQRLAAPKRLTLF